MPPTIRRPVFRVPTPAPSGFLFHVTSERHWPAIAADGTRAGTYWCDRAALVTYYASCVEDEDEVPVIVCAAGARFDRAHLEPDTPGLKEAITCALPWTQDEIDEAWDARDPGIPAWRACLDLIGSVRYAAPVAPDMLERIPLALLDARAQRAGLIG